MDLDLVGRAALVTGGSSGIGLAVVEALAAEGARVASISRNPSKELEQLSEKYGVVALHADLTRPDESVESVERAAAALGGLDVLVNNAGGVSGRPGFASFTDEDWRATFELNVFAPVRTTRAALPHLLSAGAMGGAAVVNVTSVNARQPAPSIADYSAAKAAVLNLTKALSEEFGPQGVRVNSVSPGPVLTPPWTAAGGMLEQIAGGAGASVEQVRDQVLPQSLGLTLGRMLQVGEVARLVAFLASPAAAGITGSDHVVDAGLLKAL